MKGGFAIACGHEVTASAAEDVLREGGTAVDACVAAALAAMVAEPVLAGLLGGGFLMVRPASGAPQLLDFFVQTPRRKRSEGDLDFREITAEFGTATQEFHIGAGAIATPGAAPGLTEAHTRLGRMPLKVLAEPAIAAAREGVRITAYQAELNRIVGAILKATPEAQVIFCADGERLTEGAIYRNVAFADVLETFAIEGARFVTEGEVAQALLALADRGGHLTADDLRRYQPRWRNPGTVARGGAAVHLNPPPSLGGALIGFGLEVLPRDPDAVALAQAFALTSAARREADLNDDPQAGAALLQSAEIIEKYRKRLGGLRAATRGTTHISVIDAEGMGAAMTLSNGEGCGLIAPGTGIMPNNMLGEDDLVPGDWLSWAPDQRLSSMMAPMAVDWPDGRFAMLGSGGSNRIRTALVQVLVQIIDDDARLAEAIEAPRLHVEGDPPTLDFEDIAGEEVRNALLRTFPEGRPWPDRSMFFGGVHAVARDRRGGLEAAGDPRRAGAALTG